MCLKVKENAVLKTATKDIIVYKATLGFSNDFEFISDFELFIYKKDTLYKLGSKLHKDYLNEIDEGFHSFSSLFYTINRYFQYNRAIFIIPKGANYYEGLNNNQKDSLGRVSDQIIYKGKLTLSNWIKVWINTRK